MASLCAEAKRDMNLNMSHVHLQVQNTTKTVCVFPLLDKHGILKQENKEKCKKLKSFSNQKVIKMWNSTPQRVIGQDIKYVQRG